MAADIKILAYTGLNILAIAKALNPYCRNPVYESPYFDRYGQTHKQVVLELGGDAEGVTLRYREGDTIEYILCSFCGNPDFLEWYEGMRKELIDQGICFYCFLWLKRIKGFDENDVVVNGVKYAIGPDKPSTSSSLGFGGRRFRIRFNDGREVETRNLWHGGTVPERFRDQLPDNATFVKEG